MARTHSAELNAYHEAGHAVVALYYDFNVLEITLRARTPRVYLSLPVWAKCAFIEAERSGRPIGRLVHVRDGDRKVLRRERRALADRYVRFLYAGYLAEREAYRRWGKPWPRAWTFEKLTDYYWSRAWAWLADVPRGQRRKFIMCRRVEVEETVRGAWPVIETVAKVLLKRRALYSKGLHTIVVNAAKRHGL